MAARPPGQSGAGGRGGDRGGPGWQEGGTGAPVPPSCLPPTGGAAAAAAARSPPVWVASPRGRIGGCRRGGGGGAGGGLPWRDGIVILSQRSNRNPNAHCHRTSSRRDVLLLTPPISTASLSPGPMGVFHDSDVTSGRGPGSPGCQHPSHSDVLVCQYDSTSSD